MPLRAHAHHGERPAVRMVGGTRAYCCPVPCNGRTASRDIASVHLIRLSQSTSLYQRGR
jgi:hypothetical protein